MKRKIQTFSRTRRRLLRLSAGSLAALGATTALRTSFAKETSSLSNNTLTYANGKTVPPVGMGTWLTFDVSTDSAAFESRRDVLKMFYAHGGGMIDSSPMYGQSERVVGELLENNSVADKLTFSATKIWTMAEFRGPVQLKNSFDLWKRKPLDLVYVHNLLRWEAHLKTLRHAKDEGDVRHIGLTTSHGRRHNDMERLIKTEPVDCVQFTYNILDREAERRLLPAAKDRGLCVVINRPFQGGALFSRFAGKPLPPWAEEVGCDNWAAFFLRFIISHPAVTTAIPATTRSDHMQQNMLAGKGVELTAKQRQQMVDYIESI